MDLISFDTTCEKVGWSAFLAGLITCIGSILYLKWTDVENTKQINQDLPSDYIEIPESLQQFQKLSHAFYTVIQTNTVPDWCKKEQINTEKLIEKILDYMEKYNHPNYFDVFDVLDILLTHKSSNKYIYDQANSWLDNAMWVWSIAPQRIMPYWPYPEQTDKSNTDEKK